MSEPIPEAIPTSADPRSKRPIKRLALTPTSQQANQLEALFADPSKEIQLPNPAAALQKKGVAPPPEIVANVQGSSAGAGSGEFHVYKASRRREYERLRLIEEEVKKEKEDQEFEREREEKKRRDEERTRKNKEKREKAKARSKNKGKGKNGAKPESKIGDEAGEGREGQLLGEPSSAQNGTREKRNVSDSEPTVSGVTNAEEIGLTIHDDD